MLLFNHLNSKSALQRTISALVITEWARLRTANIDSIPTYVKDRLRGCLLESIYFDEIALSYTKVLQDTKDYVLLLKDNHAAVDETLANKVKMIEWLLIYCSWGCEVHFTMLKSNFTVLSTGIKNMRRGSESFCSLSATVNWARTASRERPACSLSIFITWDIYFLSLMYQMYAGWLLF